MGRPNGDIDTVRSNFTG